MPFRQILCAVDFSPDSLEAFRIATEIARLHSGALHLLNVIEAQPAVPAEVALGILNKATGALEKLVSSAQSSLDGLRFTSEVVSGQAFHEIIDKSRTKQSDLIVLGSKGHNSFEEIVIGGTAATVLKDARCSVLIARAQSAKTE